MPLRNLHTSLDASSKGFMPDLALSIPLEVFMSNHRFKTAHFVEGLQWLDFVSPRK